MFPLIPIPHNTKALGGEEVFVVAEIGKNFIQTEEDRSVGEYLQNAKDLVDAAVAAGADAVKFQTHEVEDEILPLTFTSPHFTARGSDRYQWVTRNTRATPLEGFWRPLKNYCAERGIIFFSTPMSRQAAEKLQRLDVPFWKVGSGDVQDYVLLEHLLETKKPIIISSGMVSLKELDSVIRHIRNRGVSLVVLYCVSQYPCPSETFNLSTIQLLHERYPDVVIGFSDHSVGDHRVALAAIKLGARVIEKHLSLDRGLWGADHKVSMTPGELQTLVSAIKNRDYQSVDESPYYGVKHQELEGANNMFRPYFNKSLVAGRDIPAGTIISPEMVFSMRPKMLSQALAAERLLEVVGKRLRQALKKYDPITESLLW